MISSIHTWSTSRRRMTENGACSSGPTRGVRKKRAPKCALLVEAQQLQRPRRRRRSTQREMKRVSSEKKPCSRPSSARRSPRRSPTTNVLPSRTLSVRSDTRGPLPARARLRHRPVAALVRGRDDVDVAVRRHPGPAVARHDRRQPADRVRHRSLVRRPESRSCPPPRAPEPRPRGTRSPGSRRPSPRPSPCRTAPSQRIGISSPRARANSERFSAPADLADETHARRRRGAARSRGQRTPAAGLDDPRRAPAGTSAACAAAIAR